VKLVGTVPSKAVRKHAIELAKSVQGVKKVHARELKVSSSS
jgi:osmotically-inducible protein OsmY